MTRPRLAQVVVTLGACTAAMAGLLAQDTSGFLIGVPVQGGAPVAIRGGAIAADRVQQIPVGSGQISGIVVRADNGRPVRNAVVTLNGTSDVPVARGQGGPGGSRSGTGRGGDGTGRAVAGFEPLGGVREGGPGGSSPGQSGMPLARTVRSDDQGAFLFDHVPSGRFTVGVSRTQFLQTNYGQRAPGRSGKVIELKEGQRLSLTVPIVRTGVITGVVLGEDGEPLAQATVRAMRSVLSLGVKTLQTMGGVTSDDRGVYRLTGLQPGDFVVYATPGPGDAMQTDRLAAEGAAFEAAYQAAASVRAGTPPSVIAVNISGPQVGAIGVPGFAPTYFPGTPMIAAASTITLAPGEERANVDFRVHNVLAADVRGRVNIGAGFPAGVRVMLAYRDRATLGPPPPGGTVNPDGTFVIRGVPPGEYILMAQTMAPQRNVQIVNGQPVVQPVPATQDYPRMWARAVIAVEGQSVPEVVLELQPGRTISGHVEFDMANPPNLATARLTVMATYFGASDPRLFASGPNPSAQIQPDGRFVLEGVMPGTYVLRAGPTKSAVVNGVDTLDFPLEFTGERDVTGAVLTMTDKVSELSGQLSEATGQPGYDYTVLAVADDTRYWLPGSRRIMTARPGTGGQFVFRNLPPGGYYLAAVTDLESGSQYDPAFLKELAGAAMRVTVVEGGRHVQNIRIAR